jgi:hypothetical protein
VCIGLPTGEVIVVPGETGPRHFSAQGAPKWLRYYLYDEMNHYVDISQSLPSIESQLGRALGVEYPANVLEVRHDLTELLRAHDVRECDKVGKTLVLQIMNGAKFTRGSGAIHEELREHGCEELFRKVEARMAEFMRSLSVCRSRLADRVTTEFRNVVLKEGVDPLARTVSILCQSIERIICMRYVRFLQSRGREVTAVIHDGVLFSKTSRDEIFPQDLTNLGQQVILHDTGFDLRFNRELFEVPEKDTWRFSDVEEIELPRDLKLDIIEPFMDPPRGPHVDDLHLTRDELQMDLMEGHSNHVMDCKARQMITISPSGIMMLKCDDDKCMIHPCGSNRPIPSAWPTFFKACTQINIAGNIIVNYHGGDNGNDDGEVAVDPEHLKSMFCYLTRPGKYYEYYTRILYTKEEFFNRCIDKQTVVQYPDIMTKRIVKKTTRLWIKDRSRVQSYFDLTHVPGGSRVIPHPMGPKLENLLNNWTRRGAVPVPNGDCSLFYEWLEMLMPDKATREWFLDTLAYKYHNPDKKPGVCIQLPGVSGTGKTLLSETLCKALFGCDDEGGTFVQLDGTRKNQLVEKFNAHLSGSDVILVDELSHGMCPKNIYETMKSIITDKKMMVRRMREDLTPESSRMLWILTTNHMVVTSSSGEEKIELATRVVKTSLNSVALVDVVETITTSANSVPPLAVRCGR